MKRIALMLLLILIVTAYGALEFSVRQNIPNDVTINRINNTVSIGCPVFAVGDSGTVFKLNSDGFIISRFNLDVDYNLTGVSFENQSVGYIVGYKRDNPNKWKGAIWKTVDGGMNWTRILDVVLPQFPNNIQVPFLNVAAGFGGVVWVSSGFGYVLVSWNQGNNWTLTTNPGPPNHYGWLWGIKADYLNPEYAWVCSDQTGLITHTTNGGQSWHNYEVFPTDSLAYNDIDCYGNDEVLAAASKGRLVEIN